VNGGFLLLEDGILFRGEAVGAEGYAFGEAVFTTAMTGYQEVVTDPSYADQIVCFTAAMVGNYGVAPGHSESARAHARAVVMREARGTAWTDWLHDRGVVGSEPGLYFVGLVFLYSLSSDVLPSRMRDAKYIARHIASRERDGRSAADAPARATA